MASPLANVQCFSEKAERILGPAQAVHTAGQGADGPHLWRSHTRTINVTPDYNVPVRYLFSLGLATKHRGPFIECYPCCSPIKTRFGLRIKSDATRLPYEALTVSAWSGPLPLVLSSTAFWK